MFFFVLASCVICRKRETTRQDAGLGPVGLLFELASQTGTFMVLTTQMSGYTNFAVG